MATYNIDLHTNMDGSRVSSRLQDASRELGRLERQQKKRSTALSDMTAPMKAASVILDGWVQTNFRTEGGNLKDGKWAPFARGGRVDMETGEIDFTAKLLQKTGKLRSSFLPFHSSDNAGIGSDVPYSAKHNQGQANLPQRRMLPKRDEVIDRIRQAFEEFVFKAISR